MNEQAKLLLSAYRPSGQDAGDPTFEAALNATQADPALSKWFADQQEFDREVARKLAEVPVPAGLRERILAGTKVSAPRTWWRWPGFWLIAAAVTILTLAVAVVAPSRNVAPWQKDALAVLADLEAGRTGFNHEGGDAASLVTWLQNQNVPSPATIPNPLIGRPTYGCKTWKWNDRDISVVCFKVGARGGVHLLTINRAGLQGAPAEGGEPVFTTHGPWYVATWSRGDHTHMLVGEEGEEMLRQLVHRQQAKDRNILALTILPVR